MTFFKTILVAGTAISLLSACGGDEPTDSAETKKTVEKPAVTETSSPTTPSPAAPVAEPAGPAEEFAALPEPYRSADYKAGRRTFKLCQSCHTLNAGGQNLVGPNLYGVFGREIGGVESFGYSKAVEAADFIWTPEKLDEWLVSPRNFLPGNKMSFAGVRKERDRLAVIAYIMAETGYETPSE